MLKLRQIIISINPNRTLVIMDAAILKPNLISPSYERY